MLYIFCAYRLYVNRKTEGNFCIFAFIIGTLFFMGFVAVFDEMFIGAISKIQGKKALHLIGGAMMTGIAYTIFDTHINPSTGKCSRCGDDLIPGDNKDVFLSGA